VYRVLKLDRTVETTLEQFGISNAPKRNGFAFPMPTTAETVRHGSKLSYEELKDEAYRLANDSPRTYAEIAEDLDVTENAVAKAVTTAGPRYKRLQMRIVEVLSEYTVEREVNVQFRTWRKDRTRDE
jgi:hypothetical protein